MKFRAKLQSMIEELEYWIFIGIGDDIVEAPSQRPEYTHYVEQAKFVGVQKEDVPKFVLRLLVQDQSMPWFVNGTFWHLSKLQLKVWASKFKFWAK